MEVAIKLLSEDAKLPTFAHRTDACADLHTIEDYELQPKERKLFGTGIKLELKEGWEAQIRPRSGLAYKHGVTVLNTPGTIDSDYRGEVKVLLINHSSTPYQIKKGDRIAQMAVRQVPKIRFVEKKELNQTIRSSGGFGSTGQ